jgi:hypothetical protein
MGLNNLKTKKSKKKEIACRKTCNHLNTGSCKYNHTTLKPFTTLLSSPFLLIPLTPLKEITRRSRSSTLQNGKQLGLRFRTELNVSTSTCQVVYELIDDFGFAIIANSTFSYPFFWHGLDQVNA